MWVYPLMRMWMYALMCKWVYVLMCVYVDVYALMCWYVWQFMCWCICECMRWCVCECMHWHVYVSVYLLANKPTSQFGAHLCNTGQQRGFKLQMDVVRTLLLCNSKVGLLLLLRLDGWMRWKEGQIWRGRRVRDQSSGIGWDVEWDIGRDVETRDRMKGDLKYLSKIKQS